MMRPMILEWLKFISTPSPKHIRKLGYLRELIGIESRFKRIPGNWRSHLENSKRVILEAAEACERKNRVLVIGTGLWHDVPVDELCAQFSHVTFADIFHLPRMVRKADDYSNLKLAQVDVTETAEALWHAIRDNKPVPDVVPTVFHDGDIDLVVSLNVWSQLPVLLKEYLERKTKMTTDELEAFSQNLIAKHMDYLKGFKGRVCLISDVRRETVIDGEVTYSRDTLLGNPHPKPDETWIWDLAPRPEQDPHADIRLVVNAWKNIKN